MAKQIEFNETARRALERGIDQLADRAAKKSTPVEEPKQERRLRKAD